MQNTSLIVYVPVPDQASGLGIAPGSGIVAHAEQAQDDRVVGGGNSVKN